MRLYRVDPTAVVTVRGQRVAIALGTSGREYDAPAEALALLARFVMPAPAPRGGLAGELRRAGILVDAAAPVPPGWSPLDLAFHRQLDHPAAGHTRIAAAELVDRARWRALPAVRERAGRRFRDVLRDRRSVRAFSRRAMPAAALADFLGDALRHVPTATSHGLHCHVACYRVSGIAPAVYRYDPRRHALTRVAALGREGARLRARVGRAMRATGQPAVILVLAARFGAVLPGFERIGYHLLLREAGVHLATYYLVATDRGLAPCAIGAWEEARLARWLGLDGTSAGVVGVFSLGVPR